jgi:CBS domain-containing protein
MAEPTTDIDLRAILMSTKVGELTLADRPTLHPDDTVAAAAAEMRKASHGSALVCVEGKIVGIFTERDLLRVIASKRSLETRLGEVMTAAPRTVTTQDALFDAIRWMDEGGYRRLPVVDESGEPVGIVDVKTITHLLVECFAPGVYNQAARAQLIPKRREGA